MSYGKLELKGFGLVYDGESRVLVRRSNCQVAFDEAKITMCSTNRRSRRLAIHERLAT